MSRGSSAGIIAGFAACSRDTRVATFRFATFRFAIFRFATFRLATFRFATFRFATFRFATFLADFFADFRRAMRLRGLAVFFARLVRALFLAAFFFARFFISSPPVRHLRAGTELARRLGVQLTRPGPRETDGTLRRARERVKIVRPSRLRAAEPVRPVDLLAQDRAAPGEGLLAHLVRRDAHPPGAGRDVRRAAALEHAFRFGTARLHDPGWVNDRRVHPAVHVHDATALVGQAVGPPERHVYAADRLARPPHDELPRFALHQEDAPGAQAVEVRHAEVSGAVRMVGGGGSHRDVV